MKKVTKDDKPYNIRERAYKFADRILEISEMVPISDTTDHPRDRLLRSGTSIGANLEEADGSLTKKDFTNKMALARKEAKEARFWLKLIGSKYATPDIFDNDIQELEEIIRIVSAIINKTKNK